MKECKSCGATDMGTCKSCGDPGMIGYSCVIKAKKIPFWKWRFNRKPVMQLFTAHNMQSISYSHKYIEAVIDYPSCVGVGDVVMFHFVGIRNKVIVESIKDKYL